MDLFVFLALLQDGITTGAIYLLLAIGLLIVFSVTRVIFVPQGDLLAFGTLTAGTLQSGHLPGTLWLLDAVAAMALVASLFGGRRAALRGVLIWGVYPLAVTAAALFLAPRQMPAISILLALAIVTPMGPLIWRFAFRPIADASVLALLILAMALHFVLIGLGLVFFGPEEATAPALTDASFDLGVLNVSGPVAGRAWSAAPRWWSACVGSLARPSTARCCVPRPPIDWVRGWWASMPAPAAHWLLGSHRSSLRWPAC